MLGLSIHRITCVSWEQELPEPEDQFRKFRPPRLRAPIPQGRIAGKAGKRRWPKWLLGTIVLPIIAATGAGLLLPSGNLLSALLQEMASGLQKIRHAPERNNVAGGPYLVVKDLKASINQPAPIAITVKNSLGGETVVLSGILEGTSLSSGSPLAKTRWFLPANDLSETFISAPKNFDGVMDVTVTLYSSRQDVLGTKQGRFSWSGSGKGDKLPVTLPSSLPPAR